MVCLKLKRLLNFKQTKGERIEKLSDKLAGFLSFDLGTKPSPEPGGRLKLHN